MIKIKPSNRNTNKHTEKGMELLTTSISKVGAIESISVTEEGTIISGHARKETFDKLGMKPKEVNIASDEYPVIVRSDIHDNTKEYFEAQILANTTSKLNIDIDTELIEEIAVEYDLDIEELGVEILEDDETHLEAEEDDFDTTPPEIPITVLGDLYEIGEHRLLCGDSTQTDTFEKLMQGDLADLIITDPPYNVAYEGKTKEALTIENDSMGNDDFYQFLYDFYTAAATACKKGAAIYVWHASSEIINFAKGMVDAGWLLKQQLIWVKNSMVMGRQDYHWKHEPCLYGWLSGGSHNWYSDRKQTTVIEWDRPQRNGEHPTMKPIGLFGYQIENSSKVGDLVIDAFGGSGTTMVACEQLKRKARIVEFDPKYCDVIVKRMVKLDHTLIVKRNGVVTKDFNNAE
jgi:site-specific DNA-methyltransferase (adenine-specific)